MGTLESEITSLTEDELALVGGGIINIPELTIASPGPMSVSVTLGGGTLTISATAHSHSLTWS